MVRGDFKSLNRPEKAPARGARRGTGLGTGLLIGVFIGLVVAVAAVWWTGNLNRPAPAKTDSAAEPEPAGKPRAKAAQSASGPARKPAAADKKPATSAAPVVAHSPVLAPPPVVKPAPRPAPPPVPVTSTAPVVAAPVSKAAPAIPAPALDYHNILTKNGTPRPAPAIKPREIWWLQVAALKNEEDAKKLRARILTLKLDADAVIEPYEAGNVLLYRVRVGPYKQEEDALPATDALSRNNLQPRLLKEPVFSTPTLTGTNRP